MAVSRHFCPTRLQTNIFNANNQINDGMTTYDAAGNQTYVNGNGLIYDVEGRQTSVDGLGVNPDWSEEPEPVPFADSANPQTLNLYAYSGNTPLSNQDADGHDWITDILNQFWKNLSDPCAGRENTCTTINAKADPDISPTISAAAAMGHQGLSEWSKIPKSTEAYRFFCRWCTGPLQNRAANYYDLLHRAYNSAIKDVVQEFLANNGKSSIGQLTKEEAKALAKEILQSEKPAVKAFLDRLETTNPGSIGILETGISAPEMPMFVPFLLNIQTCGQADCSSSSSTT